MIEERIKRCVRDVPDFPAPGVLFRDLTPLWASPALFAEATAALRAAPPRGITHIAAVEARGFLPGAALAAAMRLPLVLLRKPGKLPRETARVDYALEYGSDALTMHADALNKNAAVYLIDDLIATGGTLAAAAELIGKCGGRVAHIGCVIELTQLNGRARLPGIALTALARY